MEKITGFAARDARGFDSGGLIGCQPWWSGPKRGTLISGVFGLPCLTTDIAQANVRHVRSVRRVYRPRSEPSSG
jgi:hypothetical protein